MTQEASLKILRYKIAKNSTNCDKTDTGLCDCRWFPNDYSSSINYATYDGEIDFINLKMKFKHNLFTTNGFEVINIEENIHLPEDFANNNGYSSMLIKKGEYENLELNETIIVDIEVVE